MLNSNDFLEYTTLGSEVTAFTTKRTLGRDRDRICSLLNITPDAFIMPHQTHGCDIREVNTTLLSLSETERKDALEGVDAVITNLSGILIGVSTADCIPVLLHDAEHHAIAAIHAGWKGTVLRIVQNTVSRMTELYDTNPSQLKVVIGPGISLKNFEVGTEVYEKFQQAGFDMQAIAHMYDKWHIDLPLCNKMQLTEMGVQQTNITTAHVCTFDNTQHFFSARVEQKGTVKCGRNFNAIILK